MSAAIGEGPISPARRTIDDPLVEQGDLLRAGADLVGVEHRVPVAAERPVQALLAAPTSSRRSRSAQSEHRGGCGCAEAVGIVLERPAHRGKADRRAPERFLDVVPELHVDGAVKVEEPRILELPRDEVAAFRRHRRERDLRSDQRSGRERGQRVVRDPLMPLPGVGEGKARRDDRTSAERGDGVHVLARLHQREPEPRRRPEVAGPGADHDEVGAGDGRRRDDPGELVHGLEVAAERLSARDRRVEQTAFRELRDGLTETERERPALGHHIRDAGGRPQHLHGHTRRSQALCSDATTTGFPASPSNASISAPCVSSTGSTATCTGV